MKEDFLFGRIAVLNQFITEEQLQEALDAQKNTSPPCPVGLILYNKGYITRDQLKAILEIQKKRLPRPVKSEQERKEDMAFGFLATQQQYVSVETIIDCFKKQTDLARKGLLFRLSEILVNEQFLSYSDMRSVTDLQNRKVLPCTGCDAQYNIIGLSAETEFLCRKCGDNIIVPSDLSSANESEELQEFRETLEKCDEEAQDDLPVVEMNIVSEEQDDSIDSEEIPEDNIETSEEDIPDDSIETREEDIESDDSQFEDIESESGESEEDIGNETTTGAELDEFETDETNDSDSSEFETDETSDSDSSEFETDDSDSSEFETDGTDDSDSSEFETNETSDFDSSEFETNDSDSSEFETDEIDDFDSEDSDTIQVSTKAEKDDDTDEYLALDDAPKKSKNKPPSDPDFAADTAASSLIPKIRMTSSRKSDFLGMDLANSTSKLMESRDEDEEDFEDPSEWSSSFQTSIKSEIRITSEVNTTSEDLDEDLSDDELVSIGQQNLKTADVIDHNQVKTSQKFSSNKKKSVSKEIDVEDEEIIGIGEGKKHKQ